MYVCMHAITNMMTPFLVSMILERSIMWEILLSELVANQQCILMSFQYIYRCNQQCMLMSLQYIYMYHIRQRSFQGIKDFKQSSHSEVLSSSCHEYLAFKLKMCRCRKQRFENGESVVNVPHMRSCYFCFASKNWWLVAESLQYELFFICNLHPSIGFWKFRHRSA